ncbi:MAG: NACHT domain-containing protein [Pseudonocardiaceae bacterium]
MSEPARWFIGAATATYQPESGFADRAELAGEVQRAAELFQRLGYRRVPGFGVNPGVAEFQARLRAFLTSPERRDDDIVVVYYTGHGWLDQGVLLLPMADTTADIAFTAMPAAELTGRVLSGNVVVQRLLFLLDTCYSGAGVGPIAGGAVEFLNRLRGLATTPSIAMVVAARSYQQVESGVFIQALADAVGHPASGGHEPDFLALDGLVDIVNATTPEWQHARLFLTGDGISEFVPNPRVDRWLRGLDLRTQASHRVRAARRDELTHHVLPRAQGLDTIPAGGEDLWLFTGRHRALQEVCEWLRSSTGPATMVITGDPGSGKSSLLARLFVLAHSRYRNRVPRLHTLPERTIPPVGSITRFVHARGLTSDELMSALCDACEVDTTTSPGELLASLTSRREPIVVAVDAIDEALGTRTRTGFPAVDDALGPLVRAAGRTPLRLLLGTRSHLVTALGTPATVLNLDHPSYADPDSVRRYARECLVRLSEESPYRYQPAPYLDAVTDAIAEAAGNSFLVALITARSLALQQHLADPDDPTWRAGLPRAAAEAMRDDLDTRLADQVSRARELLLPLAYAQGSGLPWEDLWPRLASALANTTYTSTDIDWLIDVAGFYIVEATSDDGRRSTYRLYHEALAEHLRATRDDPVADHTVIVTALVDHTTRLPEGYSDWDHAHPYTTTNLALHAAEAHQLDQYVTDPRFLLAAHRSPLLSALPATTTPTAQAAADAYRRADTRLTTCQPQDRPAYLQLAARTARAPHLAEAITAQDLPLSWTTGWASWRLQYPHRTVTGHTGGVWSVAFGQVEGRAVVVSGSADRTVRVWDAATGTPISEHPPQDQRSLALPSTIDLSAAVYGLVTAPTPTARLIAATELGIVSLRLPH